MSSKSTAEMSNKSIAKLAFVIVRAQEINKGGEVIGPTIRKLMEATKQFDELWDKFGYDD